MLSDQRKPLALRRSLFIGVLALGACGFSPVYGPSGEAVQLQNAVTFAAPSTEFGFGVRTALEDRFGTVGAVRYAVQIELSSQTEAAAIDTEGDIIRFDVRGKAAWALSTADGSQAANGEVRTFTSYSATGTTVATQTAERDARARLAQALADMIATDLVLAVGSLS